MSDYTPEQYAADLAAEKASGGVALKSSDPDYSLQVAEGLRAMWQRDEDIRNGGNGIDFLQDWDDADELDAFSDFD
jgi:hypothetical protein